MNGKTVKVFKIRLTPELEQALDCLNSMTIKELIGTAFTAKFRNGPDDGIEWGTEVGNGLLDAFFSIVLAHASIEEEGGEE